jgi:hypothetical protein
VPLGAARVAKRRVLWAHIVGGSEQAARAHRRHYRVGPGRHDRAVRKDDVAEILARAEVDPTCYSLNGGSDEALTILQVGPIWKVFIQERGDRHEERTFESEDDACVYFLKRIFELWHRG